MSVKRNVAMYRHVGIGLVCVFMPFRETDGHLSKLQSHYKRLLASILGIRNLEPRVKGITRIDFI